MTEPTKSHEPTLASLEQIVGDVGRGHFVEAIWHAIPELFALWKRSKRNHEEFRKALRNADDLLARGRADVDRALEAKHGSDE